MSDKKNDKKSKKDRKAQDKNAQDGGKSLPNKIKTAKVPADQAIDGGGHPEATGTSAELDIFGEKKGEWDKKREGWAEKQASKMEAHMQAFFDADEDIPLSKHLLLISVFLFFVIFLIWSNLATLDEVTRGDGKVAPSTEVQALQTMEAGMIEDIMVQEGDEVAAGQPLLRLSDIEASSNLGANRARYLGLMASVTRLQAEAEGTETVNFPDEVMKEVPGSVTEELNSFRANRLQVQNQLNVLRQQLSQREQEVRELQMRINDTRAVIRLQVEEKEMIEPLIARGSAPKIELLQLDRSIREKQTELNGYTSSLPRVRSAVQETQARINEVQSAAKAQAQTELSAKLIEMNEIKQRLSALTDRKSRTELRSPVNGIIQEIVVNTIGGVASPGQDLIKIVPKDDQLIIEARISPTDRAFIHTGQDAIVKITAYDFSIYGGLNGELIYISQDTIADDQGNSYFIVRLKTDKNHLIHKGEIKPITVGMVASVDILTGKKTVMQYLMKPFIKTIDNAMNER